MNDPLAEATAILEAHIEKRAIAQDIYEGILAALSREEIAACLRAPNPIKALIHALINARPGNEDQA